MLADAQSWLADTLTAHASVSVTYTRGRYSVTFSAIPGKPQDLRTELGRGPVRLDEQWVDFHFKPALLVLNGAAVTPERGGRLAVGGFTREVQPMGGRPALERSDLFGYLVLVHTQRVG